MNKIVATFGVSATMAGVISTVIIKAASQGGWSIVRLAAALAFTGIGAIIAAGVLAVGFAYISKLILKGNGALTSW
ncbi:hypothetical protein [Clostridium psychrophilum]|uniref:hypothetical protein n=1 Tax=Clostridium psychrophilum TaxID=132926 RepID=UPI001C0B5155|nr:hypothetical protein [Clostridium psychrophilum]MBU3182552.1 hypothetical protein [Clostridium psychrophilum]